jgi:hypothetical protein
VIQSFENTYMTLVKTGTGLRVEMVHFTLEIELRGLNSNLIAGNGLEFVYNTFAPLVVRLEQRERPVEHASAAGNTVCVAKTSREIEPDFIKEIDRCIEGGSINITKIDVHALKCIDSILDHLRNVSKETISVFAWRHGLFGSPNGVYGGSYQVASYSKDGHNWLRIPTVRSLRYMWVGREVTLPPSSTEIEEIVCKVEGGAKEPLGRQLFREAWSQRLVNPRSALVIGVAAAEVGLAASWLAKEIQSPPLRKMLRDYLPALPLRAKRRDGGPMSLPPELIKQVDDAAVHRNNVVHRGVPPEVDPERATAGAAF